LGYDIALAKLKGAVGTFAEFTVLRATDGGYQTEEFVIARDNIIASSIYYHRSTLDQTVGIIKILQFDYTTPTQFFDAMEALKAQGCDKFVFDVRYNLGGALTSIEAVLSYFLEEGDTIIRVKYKEGTEEISTVKETVYLGSLEGCSIYKDRIGIYKDINAVVLCNSSTASAAELFTASFRDYGLGEIIGEKTFGKGSMQTTFDLSRYGYSGALKLTTAMYFSAKSDSYDGVGILPDETVVLDAALADKNIYELEESEDNQLKVAMEYLYK
jgi:carboxyl-terminal processing protease